MIDFLKNAFKDMKESAKAQHQVDKAEFAAAKVEAKANFEENRFHNTYAKAKADSKAQWEEAKAMGKSETRRAMMQTERDEKIAAANERIAAANERFDIAKK